MREVALLAMAVESNRAVEDLDDHQLSVMPRFLNPARASQAARTDSAMKIASVRPEFAYTDVFFEMVGFDQSTVERVNSQMRQAQGMRFATATMEARASTLALRQAQGLPATSRDALVPPATSSDS